jgi:hypothetical protein
MDQNPGLRVYNLFRSAQAPDLYCAVPEDRPLPPFISEDAWTYSGRVDESVYVPNGFQPPAAIWASRFNGCYIFQVVGPVDGSRLFAGAAMHIGSAMVADMAVPPGMLSHDPKGAG